MYFISTTKVISLSLNSLFVFKIFLCLFILDIKWKKSILSLNFHLVSFTQFNVKKYYKILNGAWFLVMPLKYIKIRLNFSNIRIALNLNYCPQQNIFKHCMLDTKLFIDMNAGKFLAFLSSSLISYLQYKC